MCIKKCMEEEYFENFECKDCKACPTCQKNNQYFCKNCFHCKQICQVSLKIDEANTIATFYIPTVQMNLEIFKKKYLELIFKEIDEESFSISTKPNIEEIKVDFELDINAINRAQCIIKESMLYSLNLKGNIKRFFGSTLKSVNTIIKSLETFSLLSYFNFNISFIIIEFININKLFLYSFGLKPHLNSFVKEFNLFLISKNYLSNDSLLIKYFNLQDKKTNNKFNMLKTSSGIKSKENYFEEAEIFKLYEFIIICIMIILRIFYIVSKYFEKIFRYYKNPSTLL